MTITSPTQTFVDRQAIREFLDGRIQFFALPEPQWGPIGKEVFERTYARSVDVVTNDGEVLGTRIESWADTVKRVVQGSLSYVGRDHWLEDEDVELFDLIYNFKALPAGRHLWVTGTLASTFSKNCFAAETEVLTKEGVRRIGDICGREVKVLDGNGGWVMSTAKNFGLQKLVELVVKRGNHTKSIFATADHGWFIRDSNPRTSSLETRRLTTSELKPGHRLATRVAKAGGHSRWNPSPVGIQHGFVFGDGNLTRDGGSNANFCGEKDMEMVKWFPAHRLQSKTDGVLVAPDNPRAWKSVPDITEATSYLYGWLAGYFAADGSVHSVNGGMSLASSKKENIDFVRDVCYRLGIRTWPATAQHRKGFGTVETALYSVWFDPKAFTDEFFLITKHRESWAVHQDAKSRETWWTVEAVRETDRIEDVYCFEVPTTHSFVLAENILTSNCWSAGFGARTSSHFAFLASRLLEGGGVGSNYSSDVMAVTEKIGGSIRLSFRLDESHADFERVQAVAQDRLNIAEIPDYEIVVEDNREGWVSTWTKIIDLSVGLPGERSVVIDLSDVRPFGAELKTFGGTASGPDALVRSLLGMVDVLNNVVASSWSGRRLTGIEAMTIDHELASAIVAGGARRSARMAIMSWRDIEVFDFIHIKENTQSHWTTNISVEIDDDFHAALANPHYEEHAHAEAVLREIVTGMVRNGEPGMVDTDFFSRDETREVRITNPCGEVGLNSYDVDGLIAGESCNLGSIDLDVFGTDHEGAKKAFQLMARFLYRSTLNPHRDGLASHIETSNRRIGVGIMGLQGWTAAHGVRLSELEHNATLRHLLSEFRQTTRSSADAFARELGLPLPLKVTAVAPTGSIAQLRGSQPGIHPVFARYFKRRVRYSNADLGIGALRDAGHHIEDDLYAANTSVVEFFVKDAILDRYEENLIEQSDELSADQFFGLIATVQETFCGNGDGNAVSATAQIAPNMDPEELAAAVRGRLGTVKGLTVFPSISRPQSPYETISAAEYEAAVSIGLAQSSGDSNSGECVGGACPIR